MAARYKVYTNGVAHTVEALFKVYLLNGSVIIEDVRDGYKVDIGLNGDEGVDSVETMVADQERCADYVLESREASAGTAN